MFKLSMPFRSRDMINLPSSQIYRQAKLIFSLEKKQWLQQILNLPNLLNGDHLVLRTWPTRPKLLNYQLVLKKWQSRPKKYHLVPSSGITNSS